MNVLIADDEDDVRSNFVNLFEMHYKDVHIIEADTVPRLVEEVTKGVHNGNLDLILADIHMSDEKDAFGSYIVPRSYIPLKDIPEVGDSIPVIFLTGEESQKVDGISLKETILKSFEGRDKIACYQKPVDYKQIEEAIKSFS